MTRIDNNSVSCKSDSFYRWAAFTICFIAAFMVFLPYVIKGHGVLTLCMDFDAQEIPFNIFVNREIKRGNYLFNWSIDIGSSLIPSFSFYNIGSPFFWITLLFKPYFFPYLLVFLFPLKYAVAGLTSYLWLERYIDNKWIAVVGCVMYAFSGFQAMNVIFYHFHDAVALFPLLLLGIDLLLQENDWKPYAAAVFINASTNWVLFIGEVVFLVLYYFTRYQVIRRISRGELLAIIHEVQRCLGYALLGGGCAAVILVPSIFTMLGAPRIGNRISLKNGLFFSLKDYALNLRGILFPSEPMNRMSSVAELNWYSVSAYLPMVGIAPALAFLFGEQKDDDNWLRTLLLILVVMAFVPFLNSVYSAFNIEPYRRWYYMLSLILVLASVRQLDQSVRSGTARNRLIHISRVTAVLMTVIMICIILQPRTPSPERPAGVLLPVTFLVYFGAGVGGVVLLSYMMRKFTTYRRFILLLFIGVIGFSQFNLMANIHKYRKTSEWENTKTVIDNVVNSSRNLEADTLPYRWAVCIGAYPFRSYYNTNMAGSLTSRDSFTSTIGNGIFEFYEAIGYPRTIETPLGSEGLAELLSVKYYLTEGEVYGYDMSRFTETDRFNNGSRVVTVFEDPAALPIGDTYDQYLTKSEFLRIDREDRTKAMLRALIIPDEQRDTVADVIKHYDLHEGTSFSTDEMIQDVNTHRNEVSKSFEHDTRGFQCEIDSSEEKYAFFGVPFDPLWRAYVNEKREEIINANGLMAVRIQSGNNNIRFEYDTLIYKVAAAIAGLCLISCGVMAATEKYNKDRRIHNGDSSDK